jgi:hypothetical protein
MLNVRAAVQELRKGSDAAYRGWMLRRQLRSVHDCLSRGVSVSAPILDRLGASWGNTSWSAGTPFLAAMLDWMPQTEGPVVECGSGLSTLLLGLAASVARRPIVSLEHEALWATRVRNAIPVAAAAHVDLRVAPLRSYGDFDWYSIEAREIPDGVGFVVCDGPPGATRGGRYGAAAVLNPYLGRGCILMLDDSQRPEEREIMARWAREFGAVRIGGGDTYTVLRVR